MLPSITLTYVSVIARQLFVLKKLSEMLNTSVYLDKAEQNIHYG